MVSLHTERRQAGGVHLAAVVVLLGVILGEQQRGHRCQFAHAVTLAERAARARSSNAEDLTRYEFLIAATSRKAGIFSFWRVDFALNFIDWLTSSSTTVTDR
ncbi:hypothetical protein D3C80_1016050 [compost metagenome]